MHCSEKYLLSKIILVVEERDVNWGKGIYRTLTLPPLGFLDVDDTGGGQCDPHPVNPI